MFSYKALAIMSPPDIKMTTKHEKPWKKMAVQDFLLTKSSPEEGIIDIITDFIE